MKETILRSFIRFAGYWMKKTAEKSKYADLISFVTDRPGHDLRYAIDATKLTEEPGRRADNV